MIADVHLREITNKDRNGFSGKFQETLIKGQEK